MPTLTRWYIKIGMIYLILGMALIVILSIQPLAGWSGNWQLLRPVYLHFLFIGWVTQLIIGVAHWMFPKYTKDNPRGNEKYGWVILILLNVGLILRAISEPMMVIAPTEQHWGWLLALASTCLLFAGWGFIVMIWGRVKER
jgi:hypothetical protein